MNKSPSLIRIILIDFATFFSFIFPIISWVLYLLLWKEIANLNFVIVIALISLACLGIVAWRLLLITTVFNDNQCAQATISRIFFFRDRGRIDCLYEYQGQKYFGGNAIMKTRWTTAYIEGQQVTVMVDRNHPKRAFIRDLYAGGK